MNTFATVTDRPPAGQALSATDLDAIKAKQRATWAAGDFSIVGTTLQIVGESLCEAVDLRAGSKVLDVAAGNGNCSLAAARRFCDVTSTDYVLALLEDGRRRAEAERLPMVFQEADAEALPFPGESFDVVLSSFGVMFTPNHTRAASEMVRVCRREGRIGLANWTPRGFIGRLFAVVGRHVPPPPGLTPPSRWGMEEHLDDLFRASASDIHTKSR
jgi:SAM-dependent methyltransferase